MPDLQTLAVAAGALGALFLLYRFGFWIYQGRLMAKYPGYIVPDKTLAAKLATKVLTRLLSRIGVGSRRVLGLENLYAAAEKGRLLILPNHSFMLDFAVCEAALPLNYRQVGTVSEVAKGFRGTLGAWAGFIAIDTTGGKANSKAVAERTIRSYARALSFKSKDRLLIFPQGKLVYSGGIPQDSKVPGSMRTGAVRGAQLALQVFKALRKGDEAGLALVRDVHGRQADEVIAYYKRHPEALNEPLYVLPVAIDYHRRHADSDNLTLFSKRGSGATVVIGKPIDVSGLSDDPRVASETIRVAIQELLDRQRQGAFA
ncbi:MAG TPA: 1-acyl-sn-glycerol-3-phosphate acyltransferase [Candidatus Obscuribacter sp.]|nr:1-acyl-sn-glycerol-3-phosphate acyltransferase [Candidatus Obscuribacter sp.]HMY03637.1 1-acyl-sn-glycerol-3-phosphate acyltransferase [Candidatus Obscuribacter sp.]HNG21980.1 1-acyl-sn-glycerol-3-phosphate acyltransferase [Candidatus Obscuribacter sp.]HNM48513.1 1-acyl-sn-glycerol-3-phosphate acyltransferase [Candidatus Obscuribacter sp.]